MSQMTPPPGGQPPRELFSESLVTGSDRPRGRSALPISLAAHVLVIAAIVLIPVFWGADPPPAQGVQALLFNPPPPPPPPLALGSSSVKPQPVQPKTDTMPQKPTPKPDMTFTPPDEVKPIEPETSEPVPQQSGSPDGQEGGDPDGMIGGQQGGQVGGVLGGQLGGCLGCTGDAVTDYDQPARLLHQTQPAYPHEAFIKQLQGTVIVEILIDASGHVQPVRLVESIPIFDKAAIECVREWTFVPAMRRGRPVAMIAHAPIKFVVL